ncbi:MULTISPECIES: hypothetical protein [Micromonospora]|uniref:hypothetical protein n=1 Tax=Micromonospora TaxID=1873 RepID=UPI0002F67D78|nr:MULTISPECIES: hypothetical protein [Micromonospora]OHX01745.1 hypothetical protein BFV98_01465 [Micromonospora sp. WMMB235]
MSNMIVRKPRRFAEIVGMLMMHGGTDRIMFATGVPSAHPQPIIDALTDFEMPRDLVDGWGFPEFTPDVFAKLMGGNALRLHGLGGEKVRADADRARPGGPAHRAFRGVRPLTRTPRASRRKNTISPPGRGERASLAGWRNAL